MKILKTALIILISLLVGAGSTYYVAKMYPQYLGLVKTSAQVTSETEALISDISKLIDLPKDEKPTIATVSDAEKIKSQVFFAKAVNGDKVLIYTNAKKAILYRPSEKRIIEVGAVNINQQPQPSALPSPSASPITSSTPIPTQ